MSGGGKQQSLRKALGAIKDSTTVGLAKVNSDYKDLDVAIVKATNHVERPAKEKYVHAIFYYISATRPRADVAYCIRALGRRLAKTRNWAVALKTLIVIHRALREVDVTFCEEVINYGKSRRHMLNLAHFKDDSSPNAWDYSAWIRTYALFLEERLECFYLLKYDVETEKPRTNDLDTRDLLEELPALQLLLSRLLDCQPQGAAAYNIVIQLALSMVAQESMKIYNAISDGNTNLIDKFFEMPRNHAVKALDIYRRANHQAERLSEFYEICKGLDVGHGERYIKIDQPPASFLTAMEEYVRDAPRASSVQKEVTLALEYIKNTDGQEEQAPHQPPLSPEPVKEKEPPPVVSNMPDLLALDDPVPSTVGLDEKNALALAIVPMETTSSTAPPVNTSMADGTTSWELALVEAPRTSESASVSNQMAGGLDKLTLDSLYDDGLRRQAQHSYNPWETGAAQNQFSGPAAYAPYYTLGSGAAPATGPMASFGQQQHAFPMAHPMQRAGFPLQQLPPNLVNGSYGVGGLAYGANMMPYAQARNPFTGLI